MSSNIGKMRAAAAALDFVEQGMTLGLGTGSTATHFLHLLAERIGAGLEVRGVPTSDETRRLADELSIPLIAPDQADRIHLTIDGADEIDPQGRLIKGGGGALLREKIVADASDHMLVIGDASKLVARLGAFPLPVEVAPFGFTMTARRVFDAIAANRCPGKAVWLREVAQGQPFVTDGGHWILDCRCEEIASPENLAADLERIPGVMGHGLFLGLARTVIIGSAGGVDVREIA
jgi:ribose 5-phosphate isomerase A